MYRYRGYLEKLELTQELHDQAGQAQFFCRRHHKIVEQLLDSGDPSILARLADSCQTVILSIKFENY